MDISWIQTAIENGKVRITEHAFDEAVQDELTLQKIYNSVVDGEIIEEYPDDQPFPSCLIFGMTSSGVPIHSVWGYNEKTKGTVLITVYKPDPEKWINWRKRK